MEPSRINPNKQALNTKTTKKNRVRVQNQVGKKKKKKDEE